MEQKTNDTPVKKIRKPRAKKDPATKKPALTKMQRSLVRHLDAGGYASLKKVLRDENPRIQVSDMYANPIEFVHQKTLNALLRKSIIFKATNGKYYSFKYVNILADDQSKPVPFAGDGITQAEFQLSEQSDSDNSIGRPDKKRGRAKGK